jgi:hypothetical protein
MSDSAVSVRFGGDVTGLDAAVAVAKAQLNAFNTEVRKLAKEAAASGGSVNDNLSKALREASAGAAGMQKELKSLSAKPINEVEGAAKNFNKQLDKIGEFAWNNTSLSGDTIERVVNPLKGLTNAIGVVPTVALAAAAAIAALAVVTGNFAQDQLAELGKIAKETGVGANQIQGAKLVGAGAGLDSDAMVAGLKNASQQFEQFKRNAGEVKDSLEKVDEAFLKVADKAKTSGQFIDIVGQKIRNLPREEGIDLAKALFGSDAGEKLYEPIIRGQLEMQKLGATASAAGVALDDGVVKAAAEAQRQIDEASAKASGKFLAALQGLAPPVAALKVQFYGVVEAIADATAGATKFVGELNKALDDSKQLAKERSGHQTGGVPFEEAFAKERRGYGVHPDYVEGPQQQTAGESRARYAARDEDADKAKKGKGAKGDSDALNEARKEIDGQIEAVKQQTEINKQQYELDAANKKISEEQKKALVSQADDQELASIKALYEQEKQLAGQKPAQIAEINNKLEALESQHTLKMLQEQTRAAQESAKVWQQESQQMAGTLTSSLSQAIEGIVEHTKPKDAGKKLAQSLMNELISDLVKNTLTKPLEAALAPLFQGLSGAISQPLQQGFSAAVTAMTSMIQPFISSITSALSGVFSGLSGALGGAAGSSVGLGGLFAGLLAFDVGSWEVPSLGNFDGKGGFPALIHPGEMILPAGPAGNMRQALAGGGGLGAGRSSTQVSQNVHFNINANDGQDVHRWLTGNQRQVMKAITKMTRNGAGLR